MKAKHRRTCARKSRFVTRERAEKTARMWGQHVYECENCGGFHCTKSPPRAAGDESVRRFS